MVQCFLGRQALIWVDNKELFDQVLALIGHLLELRMFKVIVCVADPFEHDLLG